MTKLRWYSILMISVIVVIAGFQAFWLWDNYNRAEKELTTKVRLLFRETYNEVRDSILRNEIEKTLLQNRKVNELRIRPHAGRSGAKPAIVTAAKEPRPVSDSRSISITLKRPNDSPVNPDSLLTRQIGAVQVFSTSSDSVRSFIRSTSSTSAFRQDSSSARRPVKDTFVARLAPRISRLVPRLQLTNDSFSTSLNTIWLTDETNSPVSIKLDSLVNDSVYYEELQKRFGRVLQEENLNIPYQILKIEQGKDSVRRAVPDVMRTRMPGSRGMRVLTDTERFSLQLGKIYPYLLNQMKLPIIFSLFLVTLTCISFLLMYNSLRKQQRLALMKNDLINNITHELKTPIATVGVAIEALRNFNAMQDTTRSEEYLKISQQELQRLSLLVDKVLKLSMFENKEIEIQLQSFDLGELTEEVVSSLRLQSERQHANVYFEKQGDLLINADKLHLQSVIFNLLDNALKYSKEQSEIHVSLLQEGDLLKLIVTDNGIGIAPEYQHKIFEKFFRVPAGNTHNAKGHGLGLSYVARVVEQHGGSIDVQSEVGNGSSFIILLPKNLK